MYYCYAYLDPTIKGKFKIGDVEVNNKPFYIGKGQNKRMFWHLTYIRNRLDDNFKHHFHRKIKKLLLSNLEPIIIKIKEFEDEEESYSYEAEIIDNIGLDNLTNAFTGGKGGRGNKNFYGKHHTIESKEKIRLSHLGDKNPMYGDKWHRSEEGKLKAKEKNSGENHPNYNKSLSNKTKLKISDTLSNRKLDDNHKENISVGIKQLWEYRKKNGIKIKHENNGNNLKAIHCLTGDIKKFKSQKECSKFFGKDFRTIRNYIIKQKLLNNYIITWT